MIDLISFYKSQTSKGKYFVFFSDYDENRKAIKGTDRSANITTERLYELLKKDLKPGINN